MLELLATRWHVVALRGVVTIVFGLVALVWPSITAEALVFIFGVYALADGLFAIGTALGGSVRRDRWVIGFEGLVDVLAGGVALAWPSITAFALVLVLAAWAVASGLAEMIAAVRLRRELDHEWLLGISGAASVVVGLLLALRPREAIVAVAWLVGAFAVSFGGLLLGLAFRLRAMPGAGVDGNTAPTPGEPETL